MTAADRRGAEGPTGGTEDPAQDEQEGGEEVIRATGATGAYQRDRTGPLLDVGWTGVHSSLPAALARDGHDPRRGPVAASRAAS